MDKVIVGLGNPGSRYEDTRHNVGWMVLDRLAERAGCHRANACPRRRGGVRGRIDDLELLLVKPTTYMNLSGGAVRTILARERAPLQDLLVVVDDFALPFGRLRLRGRAAPMAATTACARSVGELGTQGFARLRVGIGEPVRGEARRARARRLRADERSRLDAVLDAAADASSSGRVRSGGGRCHRGTAGGRPSSARPASPTDRRWPASTDAPPSRPTPDSDGIVRTATGWRKLLRRPGPDAGARDG